MDFGPMSQGEQAFWFALGLAVVFAILYLMYGRGDRK